MFRLRALGMTLLLLASVTGCGSGHSGGRVVGEQHGTTTGPESGVRSSRGHGARPDPTQPPRSSPSPTSDEHPPRSSPSPTSDEHPPPYIAKVVWVSLSSGRSLQVYPTANGRVALADGAEDEAWHEVLRKAPDAATAGMRAQFDCHWAFARLAEPNKLSWNLEPWRPVVSGQRMYDTRCNPGGPEV